MFLLFQILVVYIAAIICSGWLWDKSALNADTDDPSDWDNTDDSNWLMSWRIYCKNLFAHSNRSPQGLSFFPVLVPGLPVLPFLIWFTGWSWWYLLPVIAIPCLRQWREMPVVIFALKGDGQWRMENTDSSLILDANEYKANGFYLSRIQSSCSWHIALQWPFLISFHVGFKPSWNMYIGFHRDEDNIFWGFSGYCGTMWK